MNTKVKDCLTYVILEKLDFDNVELLELNRTIHDLEQRVKQNIQDSASILEKSNLAPEISQRLRSTKAMNDNYNDFIQNIEI